MQYQINKEKFTLNKRIIAKIRVVFPSYNNLRFSPKYSFVNKKPWLLPYVWVYRIFFIAFNKSARKSIRSDNSGSNDEIIKRKKFLDNFGLL